ncbi:hypothetical protein HHI36_022785 [Cryptolaemus montrouzieri]|uniref:THD domain-containing protein n=1 Tax=Cryptolaemus montrouzieri TaxID=559131 RepID=A0ABD2PED9_9CUCU
MTGKHSDYEVIVAKNDQLTLSKYNFVILVLCFAACSALGLSFYSVLEVQKMSQELNVLKIVLTEEGITSLRNSENSADITEGLDDNFPFIKKLVEEKPKHLSRTRRNIPLERSKSMNPDSSRITENTDPLVQKSSLVQETISDGVHSVKKKSVDSEEKSETETFRPDYQNQNKVYRRKHRGRNNNQLEIIDEMSPQAGRLKSLIAIHFDGDTSKYVYGRHSNFNGNGHLRHPKKTFVDWKESDWVESIGTGNGFDINNGIVSIKESGLYFVYAQIYYLDEHDMNGYRVHKNSDIFLQCTTTSHSSERMMKGNTCYTAGVTYFDTNDAISISDITDGRYSLFEPGKSFFGLIKLGDAKSKGRTSVEV